MSRRAWQRAAVLLSLSGALGCTRSACKNTATYGSPSPDGALIAFVFQRSCAGSGGISTHVSVVGFHDSLRDGTGNVLAVDNLQPVKIVWRGPKELVVTGFSEPIYRHTRPIDSVTVEFQ